MVDPLLPRGLDDPEGLLTPRAYSASRPALLLLFLLQDRRQDSVILKFMWEFLATLHSLFVCVFVLPECFIAIFSFSSLFLLKEASSYC